MSALLLLPNPQVTGGRGRRGSLVEPINSALKNVAFKDLEFHRIIGTGQFGLVRLVRNMKTNEVYALKVRRSAGWTDQISVGSFS